MPTIQEIVAALQGGQAPGLQGAQSPIAGGGISGQGLPPVPVKVPPAVNIGGALSTPGQVPAPIVPTVPNQGVAGRSAGPPAGGLNPQTGVPQAPKGSNFLERAAFAVRNDPAVRKALVTGGLDLIGGDSGNFARNLSNSGKVGLQTLENVRAQQRAGVQQSKAEQVNLDERKEKRRATGTAEGQRERQTVAAEDQAKSARQEAKDNKEFRTALKKLEQAKLEKAGTEPSTAQERIARSIAAEKVRKGEKGPDGKELTAEAAFVLAIQEMGTKSKEEAVREAVAGARARAEFNGEPFDAVAASAKFSADFDAVRNAVTPEPTADAQSQSLSPSILRTFGLEALVNGVPTSAGNVPIVDIDPNGNPPTATLLLPDGTRRPVPFSFVMEEAAKAQGTTSTAPAAPVPTEAGIPETPQERRQRILAAQGQGLLNPLLRVAKNILSQPREDEF